MADIRPYLGNFSRFVAINLTNGLRKAFEEGGIGVVAEIGSVVETNVASKKGFLRANKRLANQMQDSVLRSYDQRVTARKETPSYRVGQNRFSGGALRRALQSPGMFVGAVDGVAFADTEILDREAKHWYRLNFGAGGAAGELYEPRTGNLKFGGVSAAQFRLDLAPSAGFFMPKGWPHAPGLPFYPTSRTLEFPTRGIPARRFFDAALVKLGDSVGPIYEEVARGLIQK